MLDQIKVSQQLQKITQDAWSVGRETTINHMLKWMLNALFEEVLIPHLNDLESKIDEMQATLLGRKDVDPDAMERRVAELEFFINRLLKLEKLNATFNAAFNGGPGESHGSTDGGVQVSQGNEKASAKGTRSRPSETRTSLS